MFNPTAIGEPQGGGLAHDILASVHKRLSTPGIWTKGSPGHGKDCLSTAIQRVIRSRADLRQAGQIDAVIHLHVMKQCATYSNVSPLPGYRPGNWIPMWNDADVRTLHDVLTVLMMATLSAHEIDDQVVRLASTGTPVSPPVMIIDDPMEGIGTITLGTITWAVPYGSDFGDASIKWGDFKAKESMELEHAW